MTNIIALLGYASGLGGRDLGSRSAPYVLQQSPYLQNLKNIVWQKIVAQPDVVAEKKFAIAELCQEIALTTDELVQQKKFFILFGGDHSSAIGTWSGVSHACHPLGLIWIDAHLDSHTPETTHSGNIHGMPLASLLGVGDPIFTELITPTPKLKAEHVCVIGARSYEPEEIALLQQLKVRVFLIDEIKKRGLSIVMQEALQIVTTGTQGFGISLDIDSLDPSEAPGTGTAEPDGLLADELKQALKLIVTQKKILGIEIAEFDPTRDRKQMTEKLIAEFVKVFQGCNHKT